MKAPSPAKGYTEAVVEANGAQEMKKSFEEIAAQDGRYAAKALRFVFEGLSATIEKIQQEQADEEESPRHIGGQELAWGLAESAKKRWGRLAKMVLEYWGVRTTRDMGEIVYLMIENEWMTSKESDRIEDFDGVFDFAKVLEEDYAFEMS